MQADALTLGEMAVHVAGVEVSFISQLLGTDLSADDQRLKLAATDGVLNEKPFPFSQEELTPAFVAAALQTGRQFAEPTISNPDGIRGRSIVSALGPVIDGTGAMARLAYHPGYHQGQAHLIKTAPGFPG